MFFFSIQVKKSHLMLTDCLRREWTLESWTTTRISSAWRARCNSTSLGRRENGATISERKKKKK